MERFRSLENDKQNSAEDQYQSNLDMNDFSSNEIFEPELDVKEKNTFLHFDESIYENLDFDPSFSSMFTTDEKNDQLAQYICTLYSGMTTLDRQHFLEKFFGIVGFFPYAGKSIFMFLLESLPLTTLFLMYCYLAIQEQKLTEQISFENLPKENKFHPIKAEFLDSNLFGTEVVQRKKKRILYTLLSLSFRLGISLYAAATFIAKYNQHVLTIVASFAKQNLNPSQFQDLIQATAFEVSLRELGRLLFLMTKSFCYFKVINFVTNIAKQFATLKKLKKQKFVLGKTISKSNLSFLRSELVGSISLKLTLLITSLVFCFLSNSFFGLLIPFFLNFLATFVSSFSNFKNLEQKKTFLSLVGDKCEIFFERFENVIEPFFFESNALILIPFRTANISIYQRGSILFQLGVIFFKKLLFPSFLGILTYKNFVGELTIMDIQNNTRRNSVAGLIVMNIQNNTQPRTCHALKELQIVLDHTPRLLTLGVDTLAELILKAKNLGIYIYSIPVLGSFLQIASSKSEMVVNYLYEHGYSPVSWNGLLRSTLYMFINRFIAKRITKMEISLFFCLAGIRLLETLVTQNIYQKELKKILSLYFETLFLTLKKIDPDFNIELDSCENSMDFYVLVGKYACEKKDVYLQAMDENFDKLNKTQSFTDSNQDLFPLILKSLEKTGKLLSMDGENLKEVKSAYAKELSFIKALEKVPITYPKNLLLDLQKTAYKPSSRDWKALAMFLRDKVGAKLSFAIETLEITRDNIQDALENFIE